MHFSVASYSRSGKCGAAWFFFKFLNEMSLWQHVASRILAECLSSNQGIKKSLVFNFHHFIIPNFTKFARITKQMREKTEWSRESERHHQWRRDNRKNAGRKCTRFLVRLKVVGAQVVERVKNRDQVIIICHETRDFFAVNSKERRGKNREKNIYIYVRIKPVFH